MFPCVFLFMLFILQRCNNVEKTTFSDRIYKIDKIRNKIL